MTGIDKEDPWDEEKERNQRKIKWDAAKRSLMKQRIKDAAKVLRDPRRG